MVRADAVRSRRGGRALRAGSQGCPTPSTERARRDDGLSAFRDRSGIAWRVCWPRASDSCANATWGASRSATTWRKAIEKGGPWYGKRGGTPVRNRPPPGATDGNAHSSGVDLERENMRPEFRPLFGSADRRHADRQSDLMDYFCIAVLAVSGLVLWSRSGWMLALLPIGISLHWGLAKWRERRIKRS